MGMARHAPLDQYHRKFHVTDHAVDGLRARGNGPNNDYPSRTVADLKNLIDEAVSHACSDGHFEDVIDDGSRRRIVTVHTLTAANEPLYAVIKRVDRGSDVIMTLLTSQQAGFNRECGKWMKRDPRTGEPMPMSLATIADTVDDQAKVVTALASVPPPSTPSQQLPPTPAGQPTAPTAPPQEASTVKKYDTTKWIRPAEAAAILGVGASRTPALAIQYNWRKHNIDGFRIAYSRDDVNAAVAARGVKETRKPAQNLGDCDGKTLAARFDAICKHLGETRTTVGKRLNTTDKVYYRWQNGSRPLKTMVQALEALEIKCGLRAAPSTPAASVAAPKVARMKAKPVADIKAAPKSAAAARIIRLTDVDGKVSYQECGEAAVNTVYQTLLADGIPATAIKVYKLIGVRLALEETDA